MYHLWMSLLGKTEKKKKEKEWNEWPKYQNIINL